MKDPREVEVVIPGALYTVPVYNVDNEGIHSNDEYEDCPNKEIGFCKGVKNDENKLRQTGVLTESLLTVCKLYLEEVNTGELKTKFTDRMLAGIQLALDAAQARIDDRNERGVNQTNKA